MGTLSMSHCPLDGKAEKGMIHEPEDLPENRPVSLSEGKERLRINPSK